MVYLVKLVQVPDQWLISSGQNHLTRYFPWNDGKYLGLTHLVVEKGVFGRVENAQTPPLSLRAV